VRQKGFAPVIILILVALIGIAGLYFLGEQKKTSTTPTSITQPSTNNSEPNLTPVDYSKPDQKLNTGTFIDKYLGISFNYLTGYKIYSLEATDKDPTTYVYLPKNPGKETESNIQYLINCIKDNRVEPVGMCNESYSDYPVILITKKAIANHIYPELKNKNCDKTKEETKTVFSCATGNLDGSPAYVYSTYIESGDETYNLSVSSTDIKEYATLINVVISTFKLK
jgi:hypothetical protein